MKVLVFTSQIYHLGGAERLAVELAEELNRRPGVRADVLSALPESFPGTEVVKERLLRNGVRSVRFLGRPPGLGARGFLSAVRQVRRILVEGHYDVVETSLMRPTTIAAWAVRNTRTWHVAGIHDIYRREHDNGVRDRFWRWSCRTSRRASFYAISHEAVDRWCDFASIDQQRVRLIYNSIHPSYFEARPDREGVSRELNLSPHSRLLLFVGRLMRRKGLDTCIEAVKPLLAEDGASLVVVGLSNAKADHQFGEKLGFVERLKEWLASDALDQHVRWLGWREDVPRLMASANVLIHPARHEGFGLVLAEALATGLPVVASSVGGIPEVVVGTDSMLVPPGDAAALRGAVQRVLARTSEEAEAARQKGRVRAEFFRTERRTDDLLEYFNELCRPRARVIP